LRHKTTQALKLPKLEPLDGLAPRFAPQTRLHETAFAGRVVATSSCTDTVHILTVHLEISWALDYRVTGCLYCTRFTRKNQSHHSASCAATAAWLQVALQNIAAWLRVAVRNTANIQTFQKYADRRPQSAYAERGVRQVALVTPVHSKSCAWYAHTGLKQARHSCSPVKLAAALSHRGARKDMHAAARAPL
jgi:hypothetical protein